jgi:hypothetical protein
MDHAAARVTPRVALDRFFSAFYARRPVTATFTGVHAFDRELPDWSPEGLRAAVDEMRAVRSDLAAAGLFADAQVEQFPEQVDPALADGCLEIQIAEHEGDHFYRRNPALWTGEAIFGVLSLVTRAFAPLEVRLSAAEARLAALPRFLSDARRTLTSSPPEWRARALRECEAADRLFAHSLPAWVSASTASTTASDGWQQSLRRARDSFRDLAAWLRDGLADAGETYAAGDAFLALLVRRGHWVPTPLEALAREAARDLDEAHDALDSRIRAAGARRWSDVEARIAADRPTRDDYLPRFARTWRRFRQVAAEHDVVTWPDAPIQYVPIPPQTRDAAPLLYYLFYRSPAPFDAPGVHDYVVPPVDGVPDEEVERRLAAAHDTAIALNHVVHHGGLGHHVQNWYAARSASRIGQVAAVDAASRIAMFCGGSLAEGWACYACDVMDQIGALTPLEQLSLRHTRVRLAARAVADLALHTGHMTLDDVTRFLAARGLMAPSTARAEAVKASMFPGTPLMYWLGTRAIHALARRLRVDEAGCPSRRVFHDRFLSYGALPVALIARLMTGTRS